MFEKQTAQSMGSGISYARRYSLAALVCIGADDDDGNEATSVNNETHRPTPQQQKTNTSTPAPASNQKMQSAADYVIQFGKEKGKTLWGVRTIGG